MVALRIYDDLSIFRGHDWLMSGGSRQIPGLPISAHQNHTEYNRTCRFRSTSYTCEYQTHTSCFFLTVCYEARKFWRPFFCVCLRYRWNLTSWALVRRAPDPLQWNHNERDGVSNHQSCDCLLNRLFGHRSKKTSKLRVTGLYEGNSPVTRKRFSIWWRHHVTYNNLSYIH